jgi:5-dehydro-2-deoxygluconokinase
MALCEQDLDPAWLGSARAVLINGTHLSTPGVFAASLGAARHVKAAGGRVAFDIDYRPVLWGVAPKDLGERRYVAHAGVTRRLQDVLPRILSLERKRKFASWAASRIRLPL